MNDDIEIFDRTGKQLAGTFYSALLDNVVTEANGFLPGATRDSSQYNGNGQLLPFVDENTLHQFTVNGMNFGYTGSDPSGNDVTRNRTEVLTIDEVKEDIILVIAGAGNFNIKANWTAMPGTGGFVPGDPNGDIISIKTQQLAQQALNRLDNAIVRKDEIRAHLGATQNRLENTVTNLTVQAESLQAAESRISDVDVATEMTTFVRNQVLTQSATSMLAQANAFPHMLLQLLQG
ncbi:MAG TPA: flagellin [Candidatus Desulfovibrio gallistercoris]|nr:flagellin [Candidatus Desulfovibrio gallistercoris]